MNKKIKYLILAIIIIALVFILLEKDCVVYTSSSYPDSETGRIVRDVIHSEVCRTNFDKVLGSINNFFHD